MTEENSPSDMGQKQHVNKSNAVPRFFDKNYDFEYFYTALFFISNQINRKLSRLSCSTEQNLLNRMLGGVTK